jgi:hypothetical protein
MFYVLWFPIKNKKVWVGLINSPNEVYPQYQYEKMNHTRGQPGEWNDQ